MMQPSSVCHAEIIVVPRGPTFSYIAGRLCDLLSVSCSKINQKQIRGVLNASSGSKHRWTSWYIYSIQCSETVAALPPQGWLLKQGQHLPLLPH